MAAINLARKFLEQPRKDIEFDDGPLSEHGDQR